MLLSIYQDANGTFYLVCNAYYWPLVNDYGNTHISAEEYDAVKEDDFEFSLFGKAWMKVHEGSPIPCLKRELNGAYFYRAPVKRYTFVWDGKKYRIPEDWHYVDMLF